MIAEQRDRYRLHFKFKREENVIGGLKSLVHCTLISSLKLQCSINCCHV